MPRRFKPPWSTEQIPDGYVVKDATGQALAYVYAREAWAVLPAERISQKSARLWQMPPRKSLRGDDTLLQALNVLRGGRHALHSAKLERPAFGCGGIGIGPCSRALRNPRNNGRARAHRQQ